MLISVRTTRIYFLLLAIVAVLNSSALGDDRPALVPWIAWQQNLDHLQSGQGHAIWHNISPMTKTETLVQYDFAFSGPKLRWDRTFDKYQFEGVDYTMNKQIEADNGKRSFDYTDKNTNRIYAREPGRREQMRWNGESFDLKYLMTPFGLPFEEIQPRLEKFDIKTAIVVDAKTGDYKVSLVPGKKNKGNIEVTFSPSHGYAPVKEIFYDTNGAITKLIERSFVKGAGDLWYIDKMHIEQYIPGNDRPNFERDIVVSSFGPNATVPDITFEPRGFGLPADVTVVDRVLGDVSYRLNFTPDEYQNRIDDAVSAAIKASGSENAATKLESADAKPTAFAVGSINRRKSNIGMIQSASYWLTVAVGVSISVVFIIKYFRRKRRT